MAQSYVSLKQQHDFELYGKAVSSSANMHDYMGRYLDINRSVMSESPATFPFLTVDKGITKK